MQGRHTFIVVLGAVHWMQCHVCMRKLWLEHCMQKSFVLPGLGVLAWCISYTITFSLSAPALAIVAHLRLLLG